MNIYRIYACAQDEHTKRVLMYEVQGETDWWVFKKSYGFKEIAKNYFVDRRGALWWVTVYFEESDHGI